MAGFEGASGCQGGGLVIEASEVRKEKRKEMEGREGSDLRAAGSGPRFKSREARN